MNERLLFTLLLFLIMGLLRIIGYWRRKAGKVAFDAARMSNADKERDRYCRLAVMAGHREACRMFSILHPDRFEEHVPNKKFKLHGI